VLYEDGTQQKRKRPRKKLFGGVGGVILRQKNQGGGQERRPHQLRATDSHIRGSKNNRKQRHCILHTKEQEKGFWEEECGSAAGEIKTYRLGNKDKRTNLLRPVKAEQTVKGKPEKGGDIADAEEKSMCLKRKKTEWDS